MAWPVGLGTFVVGVWVFTRGKKDVYGSLSLSSFPSEIYFFIGWYESLKLDTFVLKIGITYGRETLKLTEVSASDKLEGFRATKEVSSQLFFVCSISTERR